MKVRSDLVAIDSHVHLNDETVVMAQGSRGKQLAAHFGRERPVLSGDELAEEYRGQQMMAVLVNSTDSTVTGRVPVPNQHIAEVVKANPDVFLGMGAIDPWQGRLALDEIERCKDLGLIGIGELNPARQHFYPDDPRHYPLWEAMASYGMRVMFHGGYAAAGSGSRGGMGIKLQYAQPMRLDALAADFPELSIICAHPSWPWESEALAVAQHKGNVYLDLSGWSPKYFSAELRTHIRSRIPGKVLFGTDWPGLTRDHWLTEFSQLGFTPDVQRKVLLENSLRFFGLELGDEGPSDV